MDARILARFVACCRAALGASFALAPAHSAPLWLGRLGHSRGAHFFLRIVGTRDLVLATGALAALQGRGPARAWVPANAIAVTAGGIAIGLGAARALDQPRHACIPRPKLRETARSQRPLGEDTHADLHPVHDLDI